MVRPTGTTALGRLVDDYLMACRARGLSRNTIESARTPVGDDDVRVQVRITGAGHLVDVGATGEALGGDDVDAVQAAAAKHSRRSR